MASTSWVRPVCNNRNRGGSPIWFAISEPEYGSRRYESPSPVPSSSSNIDDDQAYNLNDETPFQTLIYSGRKIPSKAFSRLEKTMTRAASSERRKSQGLIAQSIISDVKINFQTHSVQRLLGHEIQAEKPGHRCCVQC